MLKVLKPIENNKSPGNDGLTKEIHEKFWNEIKHPFMNSIIEEREKKKLSTCQRQAVIKLVEEKERDKWYIKIGVLSPYQIMTIKLLLKRKQRG